MARRYSWLVVVGLSVVGVFVVMRVLRSGGGVPPVGQDSPRAVLVKAHRALIDKEERRFVECFATRNDDERAAVAAAFDCVQAAYGLRLALREHYGKDAWDTFLSLKALPAELAAHIWPRDEGVDGAAEIREAGSEARIEVPWRAEALSLRLQGVWRIELFAPGTDLRARREALARAAEALRMARDGIGKPGVTPETLARQVEEQMKVSP